MEPNEKRDQQAAPPGAQAFLEALATGPVREKSALLDLVEYQRTEIQQLRLDGRKTRLELAEVQDTVRHLQEINDVWNEQTAKLREIVRFHGLCEGCGQKHDREDRCPAVEERISTVNNVPPARPETRPEYRPSPADRALFGRQYPEIHPES